MSEELCATAALDAARRLAAPLRALAARELDHSVGAGAAGLAVCFAQLASATGEERDRVAAERYLALSIDRVAASPLSGGIGLFGGLAGVAWAELEVSRAIGEVAQPSEDVDALLAAVLEREPWPGPWDLVSGLVGLGVYALRRPPGDTPDLLGPVVAALARALRVAAWSTDTTRTFGAAADGRPLHYVDLGLAHGIAGAIAVLAAALDAGCEAARPVLAEGVGRLLAHELALDVPDGRFPAVAWPGLAAGASRLAWCYGDLGIAAALLAAGDVEGDAVATGAGRRALASAACRSVDRSRVTDAGLCHGTAGVALLFHRLAPFGQGAPHAAETWSARLFDDVRTSRLPSAPGLLDGRAGVVLALLALAGRGGGWESALLPNAATVQRRVNAGIPS